MRHLFPTTISDIHDATGLSRKGSGQKLRNKISSGKWGTKGVDWIKTREKYFLTQCFFEEVIASGLLNNDPTKEPSLFLIAKKTSVYNGKETTQQREPQINKSS